MRRSANAGLSVDGPGDGDSLGREPRMRCFQGVGAMYQVEDGEVEDGDRVVKQGCNAGVAWS